jgi:type VI secretion system protein ImpH
MARTERSAPDPVALLRSLAAEPYRFDFFQALRRIESAHRNRPRFGRSQRPGEEPVRLGEDPSLAFAPSTLSSFTSAKDGRPPRLGVSFFGAFGPNGPLPLHLTEYAYQRLYNYADPTFARFVDIFHHRLLGIFYRAWADSQPAVSHDRPDSDRFITYLGALIGIGAPTLRGRDALPDNTKLFFAGRLAAQPRNAEGLRAMIADFFQMKVAIEQFVGEWVSVADQHCWRLAAPRRRRGPAMGVLGQSTLIGRRVWERQHKFRIVLGPLRRDQFDSMLPNGPSIGRLSALVRNYVGDEFRWDVRLMLMLEAVEPVQLGKTGRLGRTSFLLRGATPRVWDDVIVDPAQRAAGEPQREAAS